LVVGLSFFFLRILFPGKRITANKRREESREPAVPFFFFSYSLFSMECDEDGRQGLSFFFSLFAGGCSPGDGRVAAAAPLPFFFSFLSSSLLLLRATRGKVVTLFSFFPFFFEILFFFRREQALAVIACHLPFLFPFFLNDPDRAPAVK